MTSYSNIKSNNHECDYLVVGAGTAGMSFIDTVLTENSTATVILVDRNALPGGHWTKAYPFVKLHIVSCNYGVNSEPLGRSLDRRRGYEKLDIFDRASGQEIVEYYCKVEKKFQSTGRFKSFFGCEYSKEEIIGRSTSNHTVHSIIKRDGEVLHLQCRKLVMIHTNVLVPSMRTAPFPVHESVNFKPVNYLPEAIKSGGFTNYVILGAGKTSSDAIIKLLESGVNQSSITWVVSQDVWFLLRDRLFFRNSTYKGSSRLAKSILKKNSTKDIFLDWERKGLIARLDHPDGSFPTVFKGATVASCEMSLLKSVKNVVRFGRVTSIDADGVMNFGNEDSTRGVQQVHLTSNNATTLFVDCMAFDFYGYASFPRNMKIYLENKINLGPLIGFFNPSLSSAIIAYLECNISEDSTKNDCLYYTSDLDPNYADFIGQLYLQIKTFMTLGKVFPPAMDFILNSRTNLDAPQHNGGMVKFIWAHISLNLLGNVVKIVEKIERGLFEDLELYCKFCERELPDKIVLSRAEKQWKKKQRKDIKKATKQKTYPSLTMTTTKRIKFCNWICTNSL